MKAHLQKFVWIILTLTACLCTGYMIVQNTENTLLIFGLFVATILMALKPKWSLRAILFLPIIGELYRVPFGPDNGLILPDIIIPIFSGIWCFKKIINTKEKLPKSKLWFPLALFIAIGTLSLAFALTFLPFKEVALSATYLIRYLSYALLAFIVMDEIHTEKDAKSLIHCTIAAALLISVAGFIQLIVYPDLKALEEFGWDPHINRLVSTWLDPNFVGGLLSFVIAICLGLTLSSKKTSHKISLLTIVAILAAALFLTYSRSAYLAIGVSILVIGLLRSRILLLSCIILFIISINVSPRAADRVGELYTSFDSLLFHSAENPDPTARLRIQSWGQTISLIEKRPILGSGYNTLKYVNYQEGFVENVDIHSASGSDASLLTILATTGLLGFIPFIWLHFLLLKNSYFTWKKHKKHNSLIEGFSLGFLAALLGLLTHSLFVNSLLFAPILLYLWIAAGILETLPLLSLKKQV